MLQVPPRLLTVAGTHSGGGAGIEADLRVCALLGVWGMTAITAVNAQNTRGCHATLPLPAAHVRAQMEAVLGDIGADAVKTGQLATGETVRAVAAALRTWPVPHVVVDPVLAASSGPALLDAAGHTALVQDLLPLASVVTPNRPEAAALLGLAPEHGGGDGRELCRRLLALGPRAVLLKGGHLDGPAADLLYDGSGFEVFTAARLPARHAGGTGCTLSTAIAAHLARGRDLPAAVAEAKALVTAAIAGGLPLGSGRGPCNVFAYFQR